MWRYLSYPSIIQPDTWEQSIQPNSLIKMTLWATARDDNFGSKFPNSGSNNSRSAALTPPTQGSNPSAPDIRPCNPHLLEGADSRLSPLLEEIETTIAPLILLPVVLIDPFGCSWSFLYSEARSWKVRAVSMMSIIF